MSEKRVSVRLSATGGRQVKAELEGVGEAGARGFGRLSREMEGANARLAAFARRARVAMAAAAAAIAAAATAMIRSGLQVIDGQAKLAASLDTTVESIQVLERAGDLAGVSMGQVEQAAMQLTRRLSQAAAGTGPAVDALTRLRLSAAELQALPLDQRIALIQDRLAEFVPEAERAAVASQLFGDRAALVFTRIDTATLRQATQDVRDFGVVVSDQDAAQIERTNDAISRLGLIWRGLSNQLAVAAAPALEAVANAMAAVARTTGPLGIAIRVLFENLGRLTSYAAGIATLMAGRFSHLDEAERRAYRIADNKLTELGEWDEAMLRDEIAGLLAEDFDLSLLGISDDDLDALLKDPEALDDDGPVEGEDDVPDLPVTPVSVQGDLWQLGSHRLICGDSTSADVVGRLLGDVRPLLMVTDPPYGVEYDPSWRNQAGAANTKRTGKVLNDDRADWREAWTLFPGDVAYVWHGALHAATVADSLVAAGFAIRSQIIWAKDRLVLSRGDYHWQHEPCWYAVRAKGKGHWAGDRKQTTLWQIANRDQDADTVHGTQKPVECMRRPILNNSSPGQAVYEPFMGSGTTLIAADTTGRVCFGAELNPAYVDVAIERWQSFTGQEALPYLMAAQAQKHVTHNEALRLLDGLVQLSVLDRDLTAPPTSPGDGDRYIVGSGAIGDWAGWDLNVALWTDGAWLRLPPRTGWRAWVEDEELLLVYDGADWIGSTPAALQNMALLGVGTTADAANPFSAKLNAALWTAKTAAEGGTGDLFYTMNKEAAGDDLGLTLQTGFVTKALVGLFGSDRFRLAVSADGSTFFDGLIVDNATGIVDQPRLPRFKAYTNYDNYVGVGTWTKIGLNNTDYNDQGAFDAANNHFVAPVDGTYLFGATLLYKINASATARMRGRLVLNGTAEIRGSLGEISATHVSLATAIWLQTMVPLTAGDTVELQGYFRVADGYFAADHTSFWGCKTG